MSGRAAHDISHVLPQGCDVLHFTASARFQSFSCLPARYCSTPCVLIRHRFGPVASPIAFLHLPCALRFTPTIVAGSTVPMVDLSPESVFFAFLSFVLAILITGLAFDDVRHPMRSNESVVLRRIRQSTLVLLLVALFAIHIIWIWTGELYLLMLGLTEFTGLVAEVCIHAFVRRVANRIDKLVLACFRGFSIYARPLEHSRYDRNNAPALWPFCGTTIIRYTCFPRKPGIPCNNDGCS
jgi:hypothetical protein